MGVDDIKIDMEIVRVLELCREIEAGSAELYRYYAEIFSSHQELAELWRKTALEEDNHARQFVLAINLQSQQVINASFIDGFTAKKTLDMVKSIYDGVRNKKPSMIDALNLAIQLDEALVAFHLTSAVHFIEEGHKKLFSALMKDDHRHVEALREFYQRLSITGSV